MISTNRNLFLDHLLDATQGTAFISIAECQSDPFGAGSARSTDSMDVTHWEQKEYFDLY